MQLRRYHCYTDAGLLCADVARRVIEIANHYIGQQDTFRVVLAGGNTPRSIYQQLRDADTDWSAWEVYFGDERCLPAGAADRNDHMAYQALLGHVPIPGAQIHVIPAELGAEEGARQYAEILAGVDGFHLVLLGMGEDGHTASLFPGHRHPQESLAVAVQDSPKLPAQRVSMGAVMLGHSDHVWFVISGESKRQALDQWQQGDAIPASQVQPAAGVDIFTDINVC